MPRGLCRCQYLTSSLMSPFDRLAEEELGNVVEHLGDCPAALGSLSLVSHLFLQASRNELFSTTSMSNISKIHGLATLLRATHCTIPGVINTLAVVFDPDSQTIPHTHTSIQTAVEALNYILDRISVRRRYIFNFDWVANTFLVVRLPNECPPLPTTNETALHLPTIRPQWHMLKEFALIGRFAQLTDFIEAISTMPLLENLVAYARWQNNQISNSNGRSRPFTLPPRLKDLRITRSSQVLLSWMLSVKNEHPSLKLIKILCWQDPGVFTIDTSTIVSLFQRLFDVSGVAILWIDNRQERAG